MAAQRTTKLPGPVMMATAKLEARLNELNGGGDQYTEGIKTGLIEALAMLMLSSADDAKQV